MKKLCLTFILTLVLTISALAGEMEAGFTPPPPPYAPAAAPTQGGDTVTTSTPSATAVDESSAADLALTEAAFGLVETVFALF